MSTRTTKWLASVCLVVFGAALFAATGGGSPPEGESDDPYSVELKSISSITREPIVPGNAPVRVRGTVLDQRLGEYIVIRDDSGTLFAETHFTVVRRINEQIEVVGIPASDGTRVYLKDAVFRSLERNPLAPTETGTAKPATLPVLAKAWEVRNLTAEQAGWGYPVRLRATVTVDTQHNSYFFAQDDTSGILIVHGRRPRLKPGDVVEVEGRSDPGGFAPIVVASNVTIVGTAPLPEARPVTLFQLATGQEGSQWIEVRGAVRSLAYSKGFVELNLGDLSGTLAVSVPAASEPTNLLDAVVRIRGACGSEANSKRQITAARMSVSSLNYVEIEEPGGGPFSLPTRPVVSVSQFLPRANLQRRMAITGVVTLCQPGRSFFLQDANDGTQVITSQTNELRPGDRVVAAGYPAFGEYGSVLRDAVFRVLEHGSPPASQPLAAGKSLDTQLHGKWVQVDARLLSHHQVGSKEVLTLEFDGRVFEAHCLKPAAGTKVPAGTVLRLAGVYRVLADEARSPVSFRLLTPSSADIRVLAQPSWWTFSRTAAVIGGLVFLTATTVIWVLMLRRQVRDRTVSLQESETKFRSLVEQSLVGVYIIQDGHFVYVNPRQAQIYGYTPEEMMHSCAVKDTVFAKDLPLVEEQIRRRVSGEVNTVHYEFRGQRKDGSIVHVEVLGNGTVFNGKPAVVGTALDISERKRAEEESYHSRQMLRTVLDTIPQRVFWKDRDLMYVGCNKALAQDCGYADPNEIIGKTDYETPWAECAERYRADDRQVMETGQPTLNSEERQIRPDGSERWLTTSKVPLHDKEGRVVGVLGTYEDITDRKHAEAALAEASALFDTLLQNSPDCIYFKDRKSRFVHCSKSFANLLRMPDLSSLIGKSDFDIFTEEHARPAYEDEQRIIRTGEPMIGKLEKETHLDGTTTWALTTKLPWRDRDGNIIGTFGISKDVTAIKAAEEKLAYERELFRALVDTFPDAIYFKDCQSRFVRLSKSKVTRARHVLTNNYRAAHPDAELPPHLADDEKCAEFLTGKTDFDVYPDDRARMSFDEEQQIIRTGKPQIGKIDKLTRIEDGQPAWYHTTRMLWRDEQGNIIGTFGVTRDITAIKEAEERVAYERELFQSLLDHFPDNIYFKDRECRFVRVSRSKVEKTLPPAQRLYFAKHPSATRDDLPAWLSNVDAFAEYLIGKTDFDTYEEESARRNFEEEQEMMRTGQPIIGKLERIAGPDDAPLWMLITKLPWSDKDGNVIGTFGISRDITPLKEAEARLEEAHQRLVETSRLAGMAEVATDVLHNVGNVLNSVNVSCSLVIDRVKNSKLANLSKVSALLQEHKDRLGEFFTQDPRGQQVPNYVAAVVEYISHEHSNLLQELEQLIKHIDHIKQIVAMQQSYAKVAGVRESVNPSQLVDDALQINAAALKRHQVQVRREFREIPLIVTEKHKVLQILVNLIRNAKYAIDESNRADGLLTVRIGNDGPGCVKIQVLDNGVGIQEENLTRIFSHGFTTRRDGHGFGLHSSALAVRELGGSLRAESGGIGRGATFTLILPLQPSTPSAV